MIDPVLTILGISILLKGLFIMLIVKFLQEILNLIYSLSMNHHGLYRFAKSFYPISIIMGVLLWIQWVFSIHFNISFL